MTLHRLGVDKRHFVRLASQHLRKLAHHTLSDTDIVWFDGGTGDMDYTLINHFHQLSRRGLGRLATRAHMHVRHAPEHRVTFLVELLPTLIGIAIKHRTASTAICPLHGFLRIGHKIHDLAAVRDILRQSFLNGRRHRRSPTQGKDTVEILEHIKHDVAFQPPEFRFPILFEVLGNPHSGIMLNLIVRIGERQLHHLRHFLADTSLARPHHADDHGDRPTHTTHRRITSYAQAMRQRTARRYAWFRQRNRRQTSQAHTARWSNAPSPRQQQPPPEPQYCRNAG